MLKFANIHSFSRKFVFPLLAACKNVKMSSGVVLSPCNAINKTRNAILRMKKCSPELRTVLRKRCQERIQNDRTKLLNTFRKIKIQDSFKVAFGNILKEEWKNIEVDELDERHLQDFPHNQFNFEDELALEEMLERELLLEHEDWLLQLYEEFLHEDLEESSEVVCPLCCLGYLKQIENLRTTCLKCSATFTVEKSLADLQAAIYECLSHHDKNCDFSSGFVIVPKNENENNLCIVCHNCLYLNVIE